MVKEQCLNYNVGIENLLHQRYSELCGHLFLDFSYQKLLQADTQKSYGLVQGASVYDFVLQMNNF